MSFLQKRLGFFIVNSGAVLDEAACHSNVCLHIQIQSKLNVLSTVTLTNFALCRYL